MKGSGGREGGRVELGGSVESDEDGKNGELNGTSRATRKVGRERMG